MIALMLAAGVSATAAAQNINRVRELLEEMQQEVEMIEKRQAETATVVPVKTEPVESVADTNGVLPLDTLPTMNDAVKIVIYNDNTWKYMRDRQYVKDSAVYVQYWDTTTLFPYRDVTLASLPASVAIDLVDSLKCYHYPGKGKLRSKYGPRRRRQHQGVDIPLKMGEPVYAVFNGRVRISQYNRGGYGNLVVIRHDNGLETFSGHLSERLVQSGDWVEAGQIIGFCGSTGRSTGPHLHFETRYCGQTFDPERLIDFESGNLRRQTFLLKNRFSISVPTWPRISRMKSRWRRRIRKPQPKKRRWPITKSAPGIRSAPLHNVTARPSRNSARSTASPPRRPCASGARCGSAEAAIFQTKRTLRRKRPLYLLSNHICRRKTAGSTLPEQCGCPLHCGVFSLCRYQSRPSMASTASITAPRKPLRSNSATPRMVVPPGEQTASLSTPGCRPVANCSLPAPATVWATMR